MRPVKADRRITNCRSFVGGNASAQIHVAKWRTTDQCGSVQAKLLRQPGTNRCGRERDINALSRWQAIGPVAFGQVMPAVICGQNDGIGHARFVERRKQAVKRGIKCSHLDAHFGATGSKRMAHIVGRRKTDGEDVGRGSPAELELAGRCERNIKRHRIEFGRRAPSRRVS